MTRVLNHIKSNAIGYLALFVALGGTSYAATQLPARSVGNRELKNHSVSADKLDRSSIAGYVRDWASVNAQGQIVASRPRAHLIRWSETGIPGGILGWNKAIPSSCFALATTDNTPPPASYASASAHSAGKNAGTVGVLLSSPSTGVHVAVICPQP